MHRAQLPLTRPLSSIMGIREDELVRKISFSVQRGRGPSDRVLLAVGDDTALFRPRLGHELLLTCDWFLEGTHFLPDKHPPDSIGWKCLARAMNDIAAMGGIPRCFLLSLALPPSDTGRWLDEFLTGLRRASHRFQCVLAGGDTTRGNKTLINVTVVGEVRRGRSILRSGARPGDIVFVSGRLGEAELGLQILKRNKRGAHSKDSPLKKHLYPEPRIALGRWLAEKCLATSMMDISDGLSADLPRLCAASDVGARIKATKIPALPISSRGGLRAIDPLRLALHGGDDYELLFTVRPKHAKSFPRSVGSVPLTRIGVVTSEKQIVLVDVNGREKRLESAGWDP